MNVDQDMLGGSCWGLLALAAADTINNTINVHTGESGLTPGNHMHRTEGVDVQDAFPIGWGKPCIFSRVKRAPGPRMPGQTRNEFGVAVGHGRAWASVWELAPGINMFSLVLRKDVREIRLKAQQQMSLEEGQRYLPAQNDEGETILVTRGDTGMLAKSFAMDCTEDLGVAIASDVVPISRFDSTISYDAITAETNKTCGFDQLPSADEMVVDDEVQEVHLDLMTGRMYSNEGREVDPDGQQSDVTGEGGEVDLDSRQSDMLAGPSSQGRHSTAVRSRRSNAESLPERYLAQVAEA